MLTSIVIVTFNKLDYTRACIESIRQYTQPGTYELIVVDNHSEDDTPLWLQEQPDVRAILNDFNAGFPVGCNQGIAVSRGDHILLLNNDTVVTARWLDNMLTALHSSSDIGAVSTLTNNCSYYQSLPVSYTSMQQMQQFADSFNRSNPELWMERLKLVGYNMLIRRSILEQIGELDERFTPGNYEDDDLSLRIRKAGYRLLLCKDTFIHHHGSISFGARSASFQQLLENNREKFVDKWGFDPTNDAIIRHDLVQLLNLPAGSRPHVLEVGCGLGGTLLEVRNTYPDAVLYGIESKTEAAKNASLVCSSFPGKAEQALEQLEQLGVKLDAIIFHRTLHTLEEPASSLSRFLRLLRPGGVMTAVVPNLLQPSIFYQLLDNTILREQLVGMSLAEIRELIRGAGFAELDITGIFNSADDNDRRVMEAIAAARGTSVPVNYNMADFIVRAVRPAE